MVYAGRAARGPAARIESTIRALLAELSLRADTLEETFGPTREPLRSVYLGGGTPTLLPSKDVVALLELVHERFGIATDAEVTIEANPGPDERGLAGELVAAGANRLSLGAQSLDGALLRRLGRRHRPEQVADAVREARAAGFASVSIDLLYDVPGQSPDAWAMTLEKALALGVDHVSAYALTLDDPDAEGLTGAQGDHLPTTAGARRWRRAAIADQDEDRAAAEYAHAVDRLGAAGFHGYEISNWARPGHESRHNLVYWRRDPYEAVGPGAHAFDGVTRRWNAARLEGYVGALVPAAGGRPALPPGGSETLDDATALAERTILALRLDEGLLADEAAAGPLGRHLDWALEAGMLERVSASEGDRYRLTTRGRLLSNELFARVV